MGTVKVTVQTEKRLNAITNMSVAIKHLAQALAQGTHVNIENCSFHGGDPAVRVDTAEAVTKTLVEEV